MQPTIGHCGCGSCLSHHCPSDSTDGSFDPAELRFQPQLDFGEAEQAIERLESAIKVSYPSILHLYLESGVFKQAANSVGGWSLAKRRREAGRNAPDARSDTELVAS
ncbi:MAG: hypothetical protein ABIW85_02685 [Variovorax sp.]